MRVITIRPRFSETDALGHINNTAIAVWFEAGRVEYIDALLAAVHGGPPDWVMATQTIDYLAESFFGEDVRVECAVTRVGNSSFEVCCRMYQREQLTVRASSVLVYIDKQTRKPSPMPADMRRQLEPELQPDWFSAES